MNRGAATASLGLDALRQVREQIGERVPRDNPEERFQVALAQELDRILDPTVIWFHTPSGMKRSKRAAAVIKAMGGKRGVPDLYLAWPDGTAWIECKAPRGTLSKDQREFRARALYLGHEYARVRTIEEARAALRTWGVPLRASAGAA